MQCALRRLGAAGVVVAALGAARAGGQDPPELRRARLHMIQRDVAAAGVRNRAVIQAMLDTPRHEFLPPAERRKAYADMALPIGEGQTISSPYIVALMTEALDPQPGDRVLEIGTGSGYQAAVLSRLVRQVYTIEIVASLGKRAARTLARLGCANVQVKIGDGFQGWPEHAPFDKVLLTCSPEKVPQPLVDQLREGGLLVAPLGDRYQQMLYRARKQGGRMAPEPLCPTLFVPMTGRAERLRTRQSDAPFSPIVNGGFEDPTAQQGYLPGWYYDRLAQWRSGPDAPEGRHYVTFRCDQPGGSARAMQGFAVDGRRVSELLVSCWVRAARRSPRGEPIYPLAITFYDDQRREAGQRRLGPLRDARTWRRAAGRVRVPAAAREAIVRIGLLGAAGELSLDGVHIQPVRAPATAAAD